MLTGAIVAYIGLASVHRDPWNLHGDPWSWPTSRPAGPPSSTARSALPGSATAIVGPVPWLVVIALLTIAVSAFILHRTILGVHIYAVGGNAQAARLTGIPVPFVLIFAYGVSGLLSGLGGVMSASRLYSAQGQLGIGYELDAIAAVILGGTSFVGGIGTVFGTLIGALIIAVLNNGLTLMNVSFYWQLVIKGAVIILAVMLDKLRTRGQAG